MLVGPLYRMFYIYTLTQTNLYKFYVCFDRNVYISTVNIKKCNLKNVFNINLNDTLMGVGDRSVDLNELSRDSLC